MTQQQFQRIQGIQGVEGIRGATVKVMARNISVRGNLMDFCYTYSAKKCRTNHRLDRSCRIQLHLSGKIRCHEQFNETKSAVIVFEYQKRTPISNLSSYNKNILFYRINPLIYPIQLDSTGNHIDPTSNISDTFKTCTNSNNALSFFAPLWPYPTLPP